MSNREAWLKEASVLISQEIFSTPTLKLPEKLAVSCGIPAGNSKAIGQCWDPKVSADGTTHIFVCPSLDDSYVVLTTLLHELCHAVIGVHHGHGKEFGRIARAVGLQGKLTSTKVDPESETGQKLKAMLTTLGEYPHKALDKRPKKKVVNRAKRLTMVSVNDPDYKVQIKEESVKAIGPPLDPWKDPMIEKEE